MIPSSKLFQPGRFTITAVHPIDSPSYGPLHRVQGVALPFGMPLHTYSYRSGVMNDEWAAERAITDFLTLY